MTLIKYFILTIKLRKCSMCSRTVAKEGKALYTDREIVILYDSSQNESVTYEEPLATPSKIPKEEFEVVYLSEDSNNPGKQCSTNRSSSITHNYDLMRANTSTYVGDFCCPKKMSRAQYNKYYLSECKSSKSPEIIDLTENCQTASNNLNSLIKNQDPPAVLNVIPHPSKTLSAPDFTLAQKNLAGDKPLIYSATRLNSKEKDTIVRLDLDIESRKKLTNDNQKKDEKYTLINSYEFTKQKGQSSMIEVVEISDSSSTECSYATCHPVFAKNFENKQSLSLTDAENKWLVNFENTKKNNESLEILSDRTEIIENNPSDSSQIDVEGFTDELLYNIPNADSDITKNTLDKVITNEDDPPVIEHVVLNIHNKKECTGVKESPALKRKKRKTNKVEVSKKETDTFVKKPKYNFNSKKRPIQLNVPSNFFKIKIMKNKIIKYPNIELNKKENLIYLNYYDNCLNDINTEYMSVALNFSYFKNKYLTEYWKERFVINEDDIYSRIIKEGKNICCEVLFSSRPYSIYLSKICLDNSSMNKIGQTICIKIQYDSFVQFRSTQMEYIKHSIERGGKNDEIDPSDVSIFTLYYKYYSQDFESNYQNLFSLSYDLKIADMKKECFKTFTHSLDIIKADDSIEKSAFLNKSLSGIAKSYPVLNNTMVLDCLENEKTSNSYDDLCCLRGEANLQIKNDRIINGYESIKSKLERNIFRYKHCNSENIHKRMNNIFLLIPELLFYIELKIRVLSNLKKLQTNVGLKYSEREISLINDLMGKFENYYEDETSTVITMEVLNSIYILRKHINIKENDLLSETQKYLYSYAFTMQYRIENNDNATIQTKISFLLFILAFTLKSNYVNEYVTNRYKEHYEDNAEWNTGIYIRIFFRNPAISRAFSLTLHLVLVYLRLSRKNCQDEITNIPIFCPFRSFLLIISECYKCNETVVTLSACPDCYLFFFDQFLKVMT